MIKCVFVQKKSCLTVLVDEQSSLLRSLLKLYQRSCQMFYLLLLQEVSVALLKAFVNGCLSIRLHCTRILT